MLAKAIDRAIDGKAFGYPSQIDFHARVMEANAVLRKQLDGIACRRLGKAAFGICLVAWQQPQFLQRGRHRDIESAMRTPMQDKCSIQHLIGPGIDGNAAFARLAIQPANVAVRIVETHQAMNFVDDRERRIDRPFRRRARCAPAADFDESAEKWLRAANAIGCVHKQPKSA